MGFILGDGRLVAGPAVELLSERKDVDLVVGEWERFSFDESQIYVPSNC